MPLIFYISIVLLSLIFIAFVVFGRYKNRWVKNLDFNFSEIGKSVEVSSGDSRYQNFTNIFSTFYLSNYTNQVCRLYKIEVGDRDFYSAVLRLKSLENCSSGFVIAYTAASVFKVEESFCISSLSDWLSTKTSQIDIFTNLEKKFGVHVGCLNDRELGEKFVEYVNTVMPLYMEIQKGNLIVVHCLETVAHSVSDTNDHGKYFLDFVLSMYNTIKGQAPNTKQDRH